MSFDGMDGNRFGPVDVVARDSTLGAISVSAPFSGAERPNRLPVRVNRSPGWRTAALERPAIPGNRRRALMGASVRTPTDLLALAGDSGPTLSAPYDHKPEGSQSMSSNGDSCPGVGKP